MDVLLSACLGIGLAAACGFRIFVPFLVMSIAAHSGHLGLSGGFEWIGSRPALIAFAVATALEILAYYVPWLDHLLDTAAVPIAIVAGVVVTASVVTDVSPLLRWSLAVIAGGGAAATTQALTTAVRHVSTLATFGIGNPLVATAEAGGSVVLTAVSLVAPLLAAALAAAGLVLLVVVVQRWRRSAAAARPAVAGQA
jgi:hypothetical protein